MAKIRVLVVEDSVTVRKRLIEILSGDPEIELVGEAQDGKRAIEMCLRLRPDLVTMDMMLPVMTGLAATEYIMMHCPTPILIVSASVNRGELFQTYEALAAGAVDVLDKPTGTEVDGLWESRFIATVKLVSRIRIITHLRPKVAGPIRPKAALAPLPFPLGKCLANQSVADRRFDLAAIGASTGGPGAIVEILQALPADFRLPIVFVLHINEPFGAAFADWLDGRVGRPVSYAREGEPVASAVGRVVMAPVGRHLIVRDGRFHLNVDPERHSCRPSVDVLFESIAENYGPRAVACLLTGMGRDGASGLLKLRQAGALTIAQDEATSVIYGMPREAVLLGAAVQVLRLDEIAGRLVSLQASGWQVPR
jgi:two-component system, chemotaxis family, protein-glutamate methylesterase/glutaminase